MLSILKYKKKKNVKPLCNFLWQLNMISLKISINGHNILKENTVRGYQCHAAYCDKTILNNYKYMSHNKEESKIKFIFLKV